MTGHLNIKTLELTLECIISRKLSTAILLGWVQSLQTLGKAFRCFIKILRNRNVLIIVLHSKILLFFLK